MSKEFRLLEPRRQASLRRKAYGRWLTEAGGVAVEFYRIPPGFLVRFCGTADFTISKSDWSVSCYPAPGRYSASFDDLYLNQVVPLILSHQGATILHASAVASPYGALAFVGGTGRGKSTLAAGFAGGGHGFMSDDGLILECRDTSWFARPNRPCFRLFADSRAAFLGDAAPFEPGDFDSKSRVEASDHLPFHATPEQICGIYFLGPGDSESTRIERIRPPDALAQLIEHSFILDAEDRKRISAHFSQLAELAEASLCYALDYPRRYERLPSTIAEIIEHADGVRRGR